MARRSKRLLLGLVAVGLGIAAHASADVVYLEGGGQYRGQVVEENSREVVIETSSGARLTVPRRDVSRIVREESAKDYVRRRLRELRGSADPDAYFRLGEWAQEHELPRGADFCWEKAIEVDAYHRPSREALGHRYHQGRWYTPEDYKRVVEGLVEWQGEWVTPREKELLEQGFVRDADGDWVDPSGERADPDRTRPAGYGGGRDSAPSGYRPEPDPEPRRPRPRPEPRPEPRPADPGAGEDTAWYHDNERISDFGSAPVHESRYYRIRTNVKEEYAERYGEMMDQYYVRFLRVFRDFIPSGDIPKSNIWVYADQREFMGATGMGQSVGGFYNTGNKRVTAYHGTFGQNGNTRTVLAHEGTHQFEDIILRGRFGNCPIWILEGLAVFFESAYYDGEDVVIGLVPRDRLAALKRGLETDSLIPLTQLIRTPQPQFTGYHYAHAWGLIYMILYYGESKSVRQNTQQWFSDLMMASLEGPVTASMVEERCGGREKFLELEEKWKEWLRDLPYDYDPR